MFIFNRRLSGVYFVLNAIDYSARDPPQGRPPRGRSFTCLCSLQCLPVVPPTYSALRRRWAKTKDRPQVLSDWQWHCGNFGFPAFDETVSDRSMEDAVEVRFSYILTKDLNQTTVDHPSENRRARPEDIPFPSENYQTGVQRNDQSLFYHEDIHIANASGPPAPRVVGRSFDQGRERGNFSHFIPFPRHHHCLRRPSAPRRR
jgi:hypothetical protein